MECDNELIQKSLRAENSLKRHLESPILNKGDASIPRVPGILGKAQLDVFKLDGTCLSEECDAAGISAETADVETERLCDTAVKDSQRRTGIDQCPRGPLAVRWARQANVDSWAKDWRIAFFPIGKPLHRSPFRDLSADADHNPISWLRDILRHGSSSRADRAKLM
jgi:hypothetical protein